MYQTVPGPWEPPRLFPDVSLNFSEDTHTRTRMRVCTVRYVRARCRMTRGIFLPAAAASCAAGAENYRNRICADDELQWAPRVRKGEKGCKYGADCALRCTSMVIYESRCFGLESVCARVWGKVDGFFSARGLRP